MSWEGTRASREGVESDEWQLRGLIVEVEVVRLRRFGWCCCSYTAVFTCLHSQQHIIPGVAGQLAPQHSSVRLSELRCWVIEDWID